MDKQIYIEFTKRNEDERIVEGWASTEAVDSQGEIVKQGALEKALSGYMRFGNIREMHQMSAVGKAINAYFDKAKGGLYLVAKVVDRDAWEKVKEGVYNGFSIGGRVLKRMENVIEELALNEISLVDRPANPEAIFTMVKVDDRGMMEQEPRNPEVILAGHILDLAREIRFTLDAFQTSGKSTQELSSALTSLKNLAVKVLSGDDRKKFDKILYDPDFKVEKYQIPQPVAEKEEEIKKYVDQNWHAGYFDQMRKVLG